MCDHLLQRDVEPAAADLEEPRQALRDLDARESLLARLRVGREHRERQREPRDVREWLSGADRKWCQHGEDLALELSTEMLQLSLVAVLDSADHDALGRERSAQVPPPQARLLLRELEDTVPDSRECLLRREAVGRANREARFRLAQ